MGTTDHASLVLNFEFCLLNFSPYDRINIERHRTPPFAALIIGR